MLRAAAGEVRRLFSHPAPGVLLLLPAALAVLSVLRLRLAAEGALSGVGEGQVYSHTLITAFEGVAAALASALPLFALVAAGLASQSLAAEHSRGTLRNLLLRPLGRTGLALGKALGVLGVVAAGYVLLAGVSVLASALAFDFADVVEILEIRTAEPWVITEASALWPPFLALLPAMLAPVLAYGALGFAMGSLARRSASGLVLAGGAVLLLDLLRVAGREYGFESFLLSAHLPSPLGDTSRVAHLLDLIRAPNDVPAGYLGASIAVPLAWAAAGILLAVFALRRRAVP